MSRHRILALWSMPRSRSTAFFRMMLERRDFRCIHEPFSNLAEFGQIDIDGHDVRGEKELLTALRYIALRQPVFFKDTTDERYTAVLESRLFLTVDAQHTFLIRDPRDAIASYYVLNPDLRRDQVGAEQLHELYMQAWEATGERPAVIDTDDLVCDPEGTVRAYCTAVSIPFVRSALTWSPGFRPEWERTRRWHVEVSRSTGFTAPGPRRRVDVESYPVLREYVRHHHPFYEELRQFALRPTEIGEVTTGSEGRDL